KEAKQLKEQEGEIISISAVAPSLGGDERRLFIYESDAKTYGDIIVLDRASLASVTEKGSFLAGKPFYINGQFATASHGYTDTALIETSLFDSDRKSLEGYNDMVIIDRHKDKILYFKTSESFAKPALYENSTRLNPSALDARYGNDGSIYTIRAEGALRAIYKNEQKLVVTDTQIAFADILPNGDIAIIAPTDRGSGLFLARNDNIYRLGEADNIIDARRIKDDLFLLVTIATRGFETKIAKLEINNDRPVRPRYNFESRDRFDLNITEPINLESKPYNALAMLRYASAYPALYTSDGYYQGSINMQFTDPLSFNTLALGFTKTDDSYAQAAYTNTRYRFYYGASGYVQLNHKTEENERNFAAEISGGYLIFNDNTSELNALLRKQYDPDDKYNAPMIASIVYSNLLKYPRSPLIDRGLSLALHTRFNDRGGENSGAVQLEYSKRLFWQFYASARAKYAASNAHTILQKEKTELLADPVNLNFYQPVDDLAAKEAFHYGWAAQIAIDAPVYFSAFPLSLHRLIPSLSYDRTTFGDLAITEKAAALEAQLLVAHKFDIALRLGVSHNSLSDKREAFFLLKTAL
ncbi:MAG: hypothetical protein LBN32_04200, partial [Helicobacteraceae bacterium]|nr:hypothetical protein [Helicobacteraceae bacterium]